MNVRHEGVSREKALLPAGRINFCFWQQLDGGSKDFYCLTPQNAIRVEVSEYLAMVIIVKSGRNWRKEKKDTQQNTRTQR